VRDEARAEYARAAELATNEQERALAAPPRRDLTGTPPDRYAR
jgi:predicted RNA polymerase sigma factor